MEQITEAFEAAGFSYDDISLAMVDISFFLKKAAHSTPLRAGMKPPSGSDDVLFDDSGAAQPQSTLCTERFTEPEPTPQTQQQDSFPYSVGDTVYLEDGKAFIIENIGKFDIQMRDPTLLYPIFRAESRENFARLMERYPQPEAAAPIQPQMTTETEAVYPAVENGLPYDIVIERLHIEEPEHTPPIPTITAENFRISDDNLGTGGAKAKFRMNMDAINLLKELEFDGRQATGGTGDFVENMSDGAALRTLSMNRSRMGKRVPRAVCRALSRGIRSCQSIHAERALYQPHRHPCHL